MSELNLSVRHKYALKVFDLRKAHLLEFHDALFHPGSHVLLPGSATASGGLPAGRLLAASIQHVEKYPNQAILLSGHADAGEPGGDLAALSKRRAENVCCLVTGDRDGWIKSSSDSQNPSDWQHFLKWMTAMGWDCDPGAHDCGATKESAPDPRSDAVKAAVRAFQMGYNKAINGGIPENGMVDKETWGAFFDVLVDLAADTLDTEMADVTKRCGKLKFLKSGMEFVGCGDKFPREVANTGILRSRADRRVETLFFEPREEDLELRCDDCKPEKCIIYKSGIVRVDVLRIPPPAWQIKSIDMLDGDELPATAASDAKDGDWNLSGLDIDEG